MKYTEEDRAGLRKAHRDLQHLRMTIGKLGPMLRRTKPGSKLHQERWDRLTVMENDAAELSSQIDVFLRLVSLEA